jgi:hypothetical protein
MDNFTITGAGYAGNAQQLAKQEPRLDQICSRWEKSLAELQALTQRLTGIANRTLGPVPEGVEKGGQPPSPNAAVARMESLQEGLNMLLARLGQTTERLEVL